MNAGVGELDGLLVGTKEGDTEMVDVIDGTKLGHAYAVAYNRV